MPVNLYGPRDDFDLATSHVIPAIIRKCVEACGRGDDSITVWGSGKPTREFLYVEDAANGILDATERYDRSDPVNLGSGEEISIRNLVETIPEITEFHGDVDWDHSKPDGQMQRRLNTSRAEEYFRLAAETDLREGLEQMVDWYENHLETADYDPTIRS